MKTGIVILNYNDFDNTKKMLEQIKKFDSLDLIVVVDNLSTDDSFVKLKKWQNDKINIIQSKKNLGYAYGNNEGLRYLIERGFNLAFISNPDILVKETVIKEMILNFKDHANISVLAPKTMENGVYSMGWKLPGFWSDFFSYFPSWFPIGKSLNQYKKGYYSGDLVLVDVVKGCFFAVRLDNMREIGLMDESTFLYYEENILGKKLKQKGYQSYIATNLEVVHALSATIDKSIRALRKYKILHESRMYYEKFYNHLNILGRMLLSGMYYLSVGAFHFLNFFRKGV